MNIREIIIELNNMKIDSSEDDVSLKRIGELSTAIRTCTDGHIACEAMIDLLERHPNVEFGTPGEPIHTLESYGEKYRPFLYASLNRKPTYMTVWMLNRIINAKDEKEKPQLIELLRKLSIHESADEATRESAMDFYLYQSK